MVVLLLVLLLCTVQAVFEVKVSAPPPPIVVLSNMPLSHTHEHTGSSGSHKHEDEEDSHSHSESSSSKKVLTEDDLIAYHFLPTPPMSTYLVAWVVGELSHNELQCPLALAPTPAPSSSSSSSGRRRLRHEGEEEHEHEHKEGGEGGKHNVTVRVWGTNDRVQQFGHARDVACAALQEMEKLTQVCVCVRVCVLSVISWDCQHNAKPKGTGNMCVCVSVSACWDSYGWDTQSSCCPRLFLSLRVNTEAGT